MRILQILTARYNEARAGLSASANATTEQATASSQTTGAQSESGRSGGGDLRMRTTPGPSAIAYAECVHQLIATLGVPFLVENASDAHNLVHQSSHALSELGVPCLRASTWPTTLINNVVTAFDKSTVQYIDVTLST